MKVKALIGYNDKELKRWVNEGEVLEVTEERANVLLKGNLSSNNKPFVEKVVEVEKPKTKKAKAKVEEVMEEAEVKEE